MNFTRWSAQAAIIKRKLYIVAGFGGNGRNSPCNLSSTEVFDITADGCEPCVDHNIPSLKVGRSLFALVVRGDEMFILGGDGESSSSPASCEAINTSTKERYDLPPMNEARRGPTAVLHDDRLVVLGGDRIDFQQTVECYCFDTKCWSYFPPMQYVRAGPCSFVYNQKIFVIGGKNYGTEVKNIECYDPATSTWSIYQNIDIPLFCAQAVAL